MKVLKDLPANYREIFSVNLQKDKKIAIFLNVISLLIGLIMVVPMNLYTNINSF